MGTSANQHFVPQYYFRNFSSNGRAINLCLTATGRPILNASIAGQCAKRNFYGDSKLESAFSATEQQHALAISRLLNFCRGRTSDPLSMDDRIHLLHAVLFQRSRTDFESQKNTGWQEQMALTMFRAHLAATNDLTDRDKMLEALDRGEFTLSMDPKHVLAQLISLAMQSAELIADLTMVVLKNFTMHPFICSDAPVVYYNTLYRRITHRGVLGLQTPGLQIFFPLSPTIVLMLFDPSAYQVATATAHMAHVTNLADVAQLNALQIHHNSNAVYFKDEKDKDYVCELWRQHNPNVRSVAGVLRHLDESNLVCRGVKDSGQLLHTFEPQLNHDLSVSFVRCNQVDPHDYRFARRDPQFVREFNTRLRRQDREHEKRVKRSADKRQRRGA